MAKQEDYFKFNEILYIYYGKKSYYFKNKEKTH